MKHPRITRPPEGTQAPAKSRYSELEDINWSINDGLHSAHGKFVESLLGSPTSDKVRLLTRFEDVGPFKVEGLIPAIDSLKQILAVVKNKYPDLYPRLTHDGMRVVRKISNSSSKSLHSWGIAIDIRVDKVKDVRFNDQALYGLTLIAPIFHDHGWYWGGAFRDQETKKGSGVYWSNEDSMHFEVSKEKLLEWHNAGLLGPVSQRRPEAKIPETTRPASTSSSSHHRSMFDWLQKGDKGPKVVQLQKALNSRGYNLKPDGVFWKKTETALRDFQRKHGLPDNGIVGPKTAAYLLFF